ncbi:tail fiber assembly protein [Pseudomonas sp. NFX71]|uniref:tail fiber assembly protein n=1 Tax=Pseudomonas sp. NFX71 TaxID=3399121 RepID=UPI003A87018E
MPYVQRDDDNHVVGLYARLQPGFAEEWMDDPVELWVPPPTEAEILAAQSLKLQGFTQQASAQKNALTERISQINDAIDFGDPSQTELSELPLRQAQLAAWRRYSTLLGRVTEQDGWYATVVWPEQPAEGMDLAVLASTPLSA